MPNDCVTGRRSRLAVGAIAFPCVLLALGLPGGSGAAAQGMERFAFEAADTDGDGLVSEAELARDAAAGFSGLDEDGSMTLTPDELGPHDAAAFERVDADGDGVLTFEEVMANKTRAFGSADKDGDGGLSFEEMVEGVESEQGGSS